MKKKLISSILCTTMLFSLGTTTIYAQETVSQDTGIVSTTISTGIALNYDDIQVCKDGNFTLIATTTPSDATITWSSADEDIATVDQNGKVVGVSLGTTTITASINDASATCKVEVLAHNYKKEVDTPARDETPGKIIERCTRCHNVSGNSQMIPAITDPVVFTPQTDTWTGGDIVFDVDLKGGTMGELVASIYENDGHFGSAKTIYEKNLDSNGKGTVTIKQSTFDELIKQWKKVYPSVEVTTFAFETSVFFDLPLTDMVEQYSYPSGKIKVGVETSTYEPEFTLTTSEWTGKEDIVVNVDSKGGNLEYAENYFYIDDVSIAGIRVKPTISLDETGKGTIVIKNEDLLNATVIGPNQDEKPDWTKVNKLEFVFYFSKDNVGKFKVAFVPVKFEAAEPEKTTTIENTSGVTMTLPEKEASGLTLQVTTSDGKAEQTAINKVVQVEGDKIKTFDLTLLKDGVPFEYNGQFTSTVSLPIPKGWNMDQLALYYFNEETSEVTPVEFTVDKTNSTVIFSTNHFSKYVLVQKATTETKKETTKTKSVKTGVETNMTANVMLWSNIALAAILGGLMLRKKPE